MGGGSISSWERHQANPYVAPVERVRPMKELSEQTSEDLAVWGQQTSWGAAFGFVYGWARGWRESRHLAGKYDATSVYHGKTGSFRVPLDVVHSSISCARWGIRIGAFSCALSGLSLLFERQRRAMLRDPAAAAAAAPPAAQQIALDPDSVPLQAAPSAAAGAVVGGSAAFLRHGGGVRVPVQWGLLGALLAGGAKALELTLDRTIHHLEARPRRGAPPTPGAGGAYRGVGVRGACAAPCAPPPRGLWSELRGGQWALVAKVAKWCGSSSGGAACRSSSGRWSSRRRLPRRPPRCRPSAGARAGRCARRAAPGVKLRLRGGGVDEWPKEL